MSRSKWKSPTFKLSTVNQKKRTPKNSIISRSSTIMPNFAGYKFKVHNGKSYVELLISKNMISHKFGEFVFTRTKYIFKNKKKKKKSKKLTKSK